MHQDVEIILLLGVPAKCAPIVLAVVEAESEEIREWVNVDILNCSYCTDDLGFRWRNASPPESGVWLARVTYHGSVSGGGCDPVEYEIEYIVEELCELSLSARTEGEKP